MIKDNSIILSILRSRDYNFFVSIFIKQEDNEYNHSFKLNSKRERGRMRQNMKIKTFNFRDFSFDSY